MKKLIRIIPTEYVGIQYTGTKVEEIQKFLNDYVNYGMDVNAEEDGSITLLNDVGDVYCSVCTNEWITVCTYDDYVQVWSEEEFDKTFKEVPNEQ